MLVARENPLLRMEVPLPFSFPFSADIPTFSVILTPPILVGGDRNEGGAGAVSSLASVVGEPSVEASVNAVEGSAVEGDSRRFAFGLSSGSSEGCRLRDPVIALLHIGNLGIRG